MDQGLGNSEACKLVAIPRGGRAGNGGTAAFPSPGQPGRRQAGPGSGSTAAGPVAVNLTEDQRVYIRPDRLREDAGIPPRSSRENSALRRPRSAARYGATPHPGSGAYRAARGPAGGPRPGRPRPESRRRSGTCPQLRDYIQARLGQEVEPGGRSAMLLRKDFPGQPEMHVAHETICQGPVRPGTRRAAPRAHARAAAHRPGPARSPPPARRPASRGSPRPMVMISDRPAEAGEPGPWPGHWEGDLIIGKDGASAIGTPRRALPPATPCSSTCPATTPPENRSATAPPQPPPSPCPPTWPRSLTWGPGKRKWPPTGAFSVATGIPVYFCDPHSPWPARQQRETPTGLLRQYFPKGTDLSAPQP